MRPGFGPAATTLYPVTWPLVLMPVLMLKPPPRSPRSGMPVTGFHRNAWTSLRDRIQTIADNGRLGWQNQTDYGKRIKAENRVGKVQAHPR